MTESFFNGCFRDLLIQDITDGLKKDLIKKIFINPKVIFANRLSTLSMVGAALDASLSAVVSSARLYRPPTMSTASKSAEQVG